MASVRVNSSATRKIERGYVPFAIVIRRSMSGPPGGETESRRMSEMDYVLMTATSTEIERGETTRVGGSWHFIRFLSLLQVPDCVGYPEKWTCRFEMSD